MPGKAPTNQCPVCGDRLAIVDSRGADESNALATRRRWCICGYKCTTKEVIISDNKEEFCR